MKKENNNRRYPGVRGARPDNAKHRKEEAKERQEAFDKLSIEDKIALLDRRLGVGNGAKKQRTALASALKAKSNGDK